MPALGHAIPLSWGFLKGSRHWTSPSHARRVIPAPAETEQRFWYVTAMPRHGRAREWRRIRPLIVNTVETLVSEETTEPEAVFVEGLLNVAPGAQATARSERDTELVPNGRASAEHLVRSRLHRRTGGAIARPRRRPDLRHGPKAQGHLDDGSLPIVVPGRRRLPADGPLTQQIMDLAGG